MAVRATSAPVAGNETGAAHALPPAGQRAASIPSGEPMTPALHRLATSRRPAAARPDSKWARTGWRRRSTSRSRRRIGSPGLSTCRATRPRCCRHRRWRRRRVGDVLANDGARTSTLFHVPVAAVYRRASRRTGAAKPAEAISFQTTTASPPAFAADDARLVNAPARGTGVHCRRRPNTSPPAPARPPPVRSKPTGHCIARAVDRDLGSCTNVVASSERVSAALQTLVAASKRAVFTDPTKDAEFSTQIARALPAPSTATLGA